MSDLQAKLRAFAPHLRGLRRGIEKESLRVRLDGALAQTPHPEALGSALFHPHITTDFSESQIELITGVHTDAQGLLNELTHLHQFVDARIGDEMLWCASMPCDLPDEDAIPIARYGSSNVARAKTVYRTGLSHRYGRRMQLISGIHYNFSLPEEAWCACGHDDADRAYFALIRNFRRHAWLLLYLFGASPAVCASFVGGRPHPLRELVPGTLYLPFATSLRMSRLGYLSEAQNTLHVSYNDLESYAASLADAMIKPYPAYEAIGLRDAGGYRQLATSLLQIENEFYSAIRPKRVIRSGERPLHALRERGVEYVEVRVMDLDPFSAIGITPQTVHFLDIFLLHCLLSDSPFDTADEVRAIATNKQDVAARGREAGLRLQRGAESVELKQWAHALLDECTPIASALDSAHNGDTYQAALVWARHAVDEPDSLASARILKEMVARYGGSHARFVIDHSRRYRDALLAKPLPADVETQLTRMAQESIDEQRALESAETVPFETFRQRYLSPDSLVLK